MKRFVLLALALSASSQVFAASTPRLDQLTIGDFDKVMKEFSANEDFYTVSPASSLGKTWGVEIGAVPGVTHTPEINSVSHNIDPTLKQMKYFPHAGILGRVSVPYGIMVEGAFLPKVGASDVHFKSSGGALQWTITDVILQSLPVSLAWKLFYTSSKLTFNTTINNSSTANTNADVTAALQDKIWGTGLTVSREFLGFLEPYVALGYDKAKASLGVEASSVALAAFIPSIGTTATSKPGSARYTAGFNAQLWFLVLGAEYVRVFSTNTYNAKLSFRF